MKRKSERLFRSCSASILIGCVLLACSAQNLHAAAPKKKSKELIAYVFPRNRAIAPDEVDARSLTRINYAFANLRNNQIVAESQFDAPNFAVLHGLKQKNPPLKVLISVGGWSWSKGFSDMALTPQSRSRFIESAVRFVEQYQLDGVDIDWEYPGMRGAGNPFRAQDREDFTLLLKELRERFDRAQKTLHRPLAISIATGSSMRFLQNTEMNKVQRYVDTVNLMTYDYYGPDSDASTGHNAPLMENPADHKHVSIAATVQAYVQAGVPREKIVLGVPFFGKSWGKVANQDHGLFQTGKTVKGFHFALNDVPNLLNHGYVRYWDAASKVPYLYSAQDQIFISYDDTESMEQKCRYVMEEDLGGVMFWEYFGDPSGVLLEAVTAGLHRDAAKSAK